MPIPHEPTPVSALPSDWIATAADMLATAVAARLQSTTPPPRAASQYLSVPEAAEVLRCRPQRVYDLLSQRRLVRYRDGSRVLLRRDELEQYLEAGMVDAR